MAAWFEKESQVEQSLTEYFTFFRVILHSTHEVSALGEWLECPPPPFYKTSEYGNTGGVHSSDFTLFSLFRACVLPKSDYSLQSWRAAQLQGHQISYQAWQWDRNCFSKKHSPPEKGHDFASRPQTLLTVALCWGWPQTALLSVSHRSTDNGSSGLEFCIVSWPSPKLPLLYSPQKVGRLMGFWWMGVLWSKYDGICSAAFKLEVNCQPTLPFFGSVHMRTLNFGLQKPRGMSPSCIFMKFVFHCLAHSPSKASRLVGPFCYQLLSTLMDQWSGPMWWSGVIFNSESPFGSSTTWALKLICHRHVKVPVNR